MTSLTDSAKDLLARRVLALCGERRCFIGCAESLTGGLLADSFVRIPGASQVFLGSEVTYDIRLKNALLNVDGNVLSQKGAVEPSVAEQMALGVSSKFSDIVHGPVLGLSTTGLAGPLGEEGKPVGLVYVGLALNGSVSHKKLDLRGSRQEIRYDSVVELLKLVPDFLASTL